MRSGRLDDEHEFGEDWALRVAMCDVFTRVDAYDVRGVTPAPVEYVVEGDCNRWFAPIHDEHSIGAVWECDGYVSLLVLLASVANRTGCYVCYTLG